MIPKMPDEYKGKYLKKKTQDNIIPREWTKEEEEWIWSLRKQGYSAKDIALSCDRTKDVVNMKLNRLRQSKNNYNNDHILDKYKANLDFINHIKPKSVLDVFCGENSYYKNNINNLKKIITNDINKNIEADYHMDYLKFLAKMYSDNQTFDIVDLDTFGIAIEGFDLAIKMAKKGIIVTLGELSCKRYKRLDKICRNYDIYSIEDITTENLIKNLKRRALKDKKEIIPYIIKEWNGVSRVYFEINKINIMTCNIIEKVKDLLVYKGEN